MIIYIIILYDYDIFKYYRTFDRKSKNNNVIVYIHKKVKNLRT